MKTLFKYTSLIALAFIFTLNLTSCEATRNANNKQKGAVIGAAAGSVLGAIIGNNAGKGGNGEVGAVIGGVVGGAAGVLIGKKMDKQAQQIEQEIPGAQVERVEDAIVITFDETSGVYFDTNKYNINDASRAHLNKLAGVLAEYPDTNVLVVGHTDSTGSEEYNMSLSKNRAYAVTNYFTQTKGLVSSRFTTNWFGEQSPVGDNATEAGRQQNRRVNIAITPNEKMVKDAEQQSNGGQ